MRPQSAASQPFGRAWVQKELSCSNGCEKQAQVEHTLQIDSELLSECFQKTFSLLPVSYAVASNPSGLKGKGIIWKPLGFWKSINVEDSLLCFRAAQRNKIHPIWMQTQREHKWVLFCVSSSTQSISWWEEGIWEEGIWEERMVKQL